MKLIKQDGNEFTIQAIKLESLLKVNRKITADLELTRNIGRNAECVFLYPLSLVSLN